MRFEQEKPDGAIFDGHATPWPWHTAPRLVYLVPETGERVQVPNVPYNQPILSEIRRLEFELYHAPRVTESERKHLSDNAEQWERAILRLRGLEFNNLNRGRTDRL
jgi:hypothetical protein